MDIIGRNPCEAVTRPSLQRSDAKAIAPEEVTRLLTVQQTQALFRGLAQVLSSHPKA